MSYTGTQAQSGVGGILSINTATGTTPTWTPIGEVKQAPWQNRTNKPIDASNLSSTFEEFIFGLPNPGELPIVSNRIPGMGDAGQSAVDASYRAATKKQYQLTLPKGEAQATTGDTYVFTAGVTECSSVSELKADAVIDFKFTLKLSGPDTFTAGS